MSIDILGVPSAHKFLPITLLFINIFLIRLEIEIDLPLLELPSSKFLSLPILPETLLNLNF